jgi:putative ABC transport system ATP-binding protein
MNKSLLNIQNGSLQFNRKDKKILSHINLDIYPQDFCVILGSNGSGKSSLLKLIDRQYHLSSGKILFNHQSLDEYSTHDLSDTIKTLTQNTHESLFTSLTLFENYLIFSKQRNNQKSLLDCQQYIAQFNSRLSIKTNELVENLSGGEKQSLALGLIFLHPPTLLLLDEHTSALDPKSANRIMELTKKMVVKNNITCIMTTHDLEEARLYATNIVALKEGKIHHQMKNKPGLSIQELLENCF